MDKIFVTMSYDEIVNSLNVKTNRCGYISKEEAEKNGFTAKEWDKFVARAKRLKKIIKDKGFSRASFFVFAKDNDNNLYILDGQGRRMALKLMETEDGFDMSNMTFECILYVKPMTTSEMSKLIIDLNTGNSNWLTKDVRRSDVIASDNEKVKKAYFEVEELKNKYDMRDYVANLLTYGEKASHQRTSKSEPLSTDDYAITKEVFTGAYVKLITTVSTKYDKDGNIIERPKNVQNKIRNVNFAISFNSCLRSIVKYHNNDVNAAKNDINKFVNSIIKEANGSDAWVEQFFYCAKSDKNEVLVKMKRAISSSTYKNAFQVCSNQ